MEATGRTEFRAGYVISLDGTGCFAIFGPGRELKERTVRIEEASQFESMSEATMAALLAGLGDFTVKLRSQGERGGEGLGEGEEA